MQSLSSEIGKFLSESNLTLSVAESCSAGGISSEICRISGSSVYFLGGIVSYSNKSKIRDLGVSEIDINNELIGYQKLLTTFLDSKQLSICIYEEPFIKNKLNVFEPENPSVETKVDVFLIPGLAFTTDGKRLGRGGGFYDQMLNFYPKSLKIGITSNERVLEDIPIEDHDILLDYVFTNDKYYKS